VGIGGSLSPPNRRYGSDRNISHLNARDIWARKVLNIQDKIVMASGTQMSYQFARMLTHWLIEDIPNFSSASMA
jgi:hypothetical protein